MNYHGGPMMLISKSANDLNEGPKDQLAFTLLSPIALS